MARTLAILKIVTRLVRRDLASYVAVGGNNLVVCLALIATAGFAAIAPFLLIIGLAVIVPLSSDPLKTLPQSRLLLWPLSPREHVGLRIGSLALSPILWGGFLVAFSKAGVQSALLFLLVGIGAYALTLLASYGASHNPTLDPMRWIPRIPGRLGGIMRIAARQILATLDIYVAILMSLGVIAYRVLASHPNQDAFPICSALIALTLSTYVQQMFGYDSNAAMTRYHLLPLRGWQVLLGKDLAYLLILLILTAPIDAGVGLTFGLASVVIGRYPALALRKSQTRWRFTNGDIRFGFAQIIAGFALGISNRRAGWQCFGGAAVLYLISLGIGGWIWDRGRFSQS